MVVDEDDLSSIMEILGAVSVSRVSSLRRQVQFFWRAYFSTLRAISLSTLQIINDRVFPYTALKYEDWNDPPSSVSSFCPTTITTTTIITIIITEMIFMVLSSWQSHCESSPSSFDECRLSAEVAADPQTKPTDLDCNSAGNGSYHPHSPLPFIIT